MVADNKKPRHLEAVGLFAGIGGIETGLRRHGHSAVLLSEINPSATAVLRRHFSDAKLDGDVCEMATIPACDIVAAGFPCQDLSQCGNARGITGRQSSLVKEVFRLIRSARPRPEWLLLENVPFMLQLDKGKAMTFITGELRKLGYRWAYRTVNAMSFGVPQRRLRVVMLASRTADPRDVLFADDAGEPEAPMAPEGCGFYWTEGAKGLGWAPDCVPTLKGGSTIGIPSPPAIWIRSERRLVTIDIRDAERLQGFPVNWTKPADGTDEKAGVRWKLVGNAVCVRVAAWVGKRLAQPGTTCCEYGYELDKDSRWPSAAYGDDEGTRAVIASTWPVDAPRRSILEFLRFRMQPLSARATSGFLRRAKDSQLRFEKQFLPDVEHHLETVTNGAI